MPGSRAVVARCPGLRVPGAFDGFELAVRAILGQRISVRAATTLAGRLADRFGEPIETPMPRPDPPGPNAGTTGSRRASRADRAGDRRPACREHPGASLGLSIARNRPGTEP